MVNVKKFLNFLLVVGASPQILDLWLWTYTILIEVKIVYLY